MNVALKRLENSQNISSSLVDIDQVNTDVIFLYRYVKKIINTGVHLDQ
jgi:hypothetical protein